MAEPGWKVGVVGRTGAGKSSLLHALFRYTECEPGSKIHIDGFDISEVEIGKVRSSMSLIPQSPFLFEGGSLRSNLDPFGRSEDAQIWMAL